MCLKQSQRIKTNFLKPQKDISFFHPHVFKVAVTSWLWTLVLLICSLLRKELTDSYFSGYLAHFSEFINVFYDLCWNNPAVRLTSAFRKVNISIRENRIHQKVEFPVDGAGDSCVIVCSICTKAALFGRWRPKPMSRRRQRPVNVERGTRPCK